MMRIFRDIRPSLPSEMAYDISHTVETRQQAAERLMSEAILNYKSINWGMSRMAHLERIARLATDVLLCGENETARYWLSLYNRTY